MEDELVEVDDNLFRPDFVHYSNCFGGKKLNIPTNSMNELSKADKNSLKSMLTHTVDLEALY